uniref:Patched domain containing 3 n=1 Tax=Panagrolaimus sp. ES5 TaxID=591445 RepID=A0AC34GNV0_9BILA
MSIVCFIIIPSIFYTGIALLSIISIAFTLVGVLGWWGSDLDPVTMINVLMAIGFSVDFCAHVCYHYFKYCNKTFDSVPKNIWDCQRLYLIMKSVGRPTLEAALSTMICMIPLFFIDVYIVQCFAKTVVCVGTLGILHGLFLIPVALSSKDSFSIAKESGSEKSLFSTATTAATDTESATERNQML